MFKDKMIEQKKEYFEQRIWLSGRIAHCISMGDQEEKVKEYRKEINALDEAMKIIFN